MIVGQGNHHYPVLSLLRPEDLRIAKIGHIQIQNRICRILRPGTSTVIAKRKILRLQSGPGFRFGSVPRVDRDQTMLTAGAEAARIVLVNDRAARENHHAVLFRQRHRQLLPMKKITADRVPPAHVAPLVAERIVLKE